VSKENVEFVEAIYSAAGGMEKDQLVDALPELVAKLCDPQIEWVEDPSRADARTYRGHEGVLRSFEAWLEQFSAYGFELERVADLGGDDVLVIATERGEGEASGAPVSSRIHVVVTVRDRKVRRYREFYDEGSALDAVGLSELPD